jgi:recombination protein RecT
LDYYDRLKGKAYFTDPSTWKQRDDGKTDKIIGYYAWFELLNGFLKEYYMTKDEVRKHGKTYSKAFNFKDSVWQLNFDAMGRKTVLKNLLRTYGKLGRGSNLDKAMKIDQGFTEDLETNEVKYFDNPESNDTIEGEVIESQEAFDENTLDDEFRNG